MFCKYAVIGNPIEHSKSPEIHAAFAEQTGEEVLYTRILGDMEDFNGDVHDFLNDGGCGLNVTVPFKERAFQMVDDLSERAELAGSVNTLIVATGNELRGDNTDGVGLITDLAKNHGFEFTGKRILVVGAGGATRGIIAPLLYKNPVSVTIVNRTVSRAEELALRFVNYGPVAACGFDQLGGKFDLIINATSAGIHGEVPPLPDGLLAEDGWTYDMMYSNEPTAFVKWGKAQGAAISLDGLGMLVEQAAESFWLWRGVRPDTAPVIAMLRE
ncbi:shikimate dehydrogenase [Solemya velum gill symbiont]|uniref:Shikimate dehydrogenase (NADP(+)) n=1 Tax=Solemya velum gill symbiont TaxID=2340 RepID=A0A0B0HG66_SOVGS|nr:shikimate dehydrogenase [Solemya velum gill symbiont]KHF26451.1 shikimate dehydrogenase [Solemya velum gill symbiont]OOY51180.1 shikimate dehydrogenase [Solemya velum gill symbiont]OOY56314.1 shikimate dehydrogenase [Solemya velum gill symbiont]OOY56651.1 shikimate dehydrogenase [Solemya velum gill symbiont]OOY59700.1 shikimate dehydrogenase [Solemya velum gill symbiont]